MLGPIKTIITKPKTLTYAHNAVKNVMQKTTQTAMNPNTLDISMFHQYMFSKQFHLGFNVDEIKKLFSFDGDNFFTEVYNFFVKKLNIPEKLKPKIGECQLGNGVGMSYLWNQNILAKNPNAPMQTKEEIFSLIRHELQHWSQYMDIYRYPKTGSKMVDLCTDMAVQQELAGLDHVVKNFSSEQLLTLGLDGDTIKMIQKLKEFLAKNDTKSYDELFNAYKTNVDSAYRGQYNAFKDQVVAEMGSLSSDSRAARRAEKFFDATTAETYLKADGNPHAGKYAVDIREEEAAVTQLVALEDLETTMGKKPCWIKAYKERLKQLYEMTKDDKQMADELTETSQQLAIDSKEKTIEFCKYLYD